MQEILKNERQIRNAQRPTYIIPPSFAFSYHTHVHIQPPQNHLTHTVPVSNTLAKMLISRVIREPFELVLHRLAEM